MGRCPGGCGRNFALWPQLLGRRQSKFRLVSESIARHPAAKSPDRSRAQIRRSHQAWRPTKLKRYPRQVDALYRGHVPEDRDEYYRALTCLIHLPCLHPDRTNGSDADHRGHVPSRPLFFLNRASRTCPASAI